MYVCMNGTTSEFVWLEWNRSRPKGGKNKKSRAYFLHIWTRLTLYVQYDRCICGSIIIFGSLHLWYCRLFLWLAHLYIHTDGQAWQKFSPHHNNKILAILDP